MSHVEWAVQVRTLLDQGFDESDTFTKPDYLSKPYTEQQARTRVRQLNSRTHRDDTTGLPNARLVTRVVTDWEPVEGS